MFQTTNQIQSERFNAKYGRHTGIPNNHPKSVTLALAPGPTGGKMRISVYATYAQNNNIPRSCT